MELSYRDEKSMLMGSMSFKKMSRDRDFANIVTETAPPFYFVSRNKDQTVRIK